MVNIYLAGIIGGLVGGVVFGVMMTMMGMMKMIAQMAKSESLAVGWVMHLIFASIIGLIYVLIIPAIHWGFGIGSGLLYGVVWWVIGPDLIMPTMMGMKPRLAWNSLPGHLIYGLLLGLVVSWLV